MLHQIRNKSDTKFKKTLFSIIFYIHGKGLKKILNVPTSYCQGEPVIALTVNKKLNFPDSSKLSLF